MPVSARGPERYALSRRIFLTGLGLVYACAFLSLWVQLEGLLGSRGITPAGSVLAEAEAILGTARFWRLPTLLWLWRGDAALHALCAGGLVAALAGALGVLPRAAFAACWACYLSLVSVGGVFFHYQWDILLLETGLLAIALAPWRMRAEAAVGRPALWLLRFLLFKLMLLSGAAKLLSGDPTWRDLSALSYHYWTQPLPTWTSWFAAQLPDLVQRASVAATLAIEIVLPFLVFGPRRARLVAAAGFVLLQLLIAATGNYGFFNLLTLCLCVLLVDDGSLRALGRRLGRRTPAEGADGAAPVPAEAWTAARVAAAGLAALLIALSGQRMLDRLGLSFWRPAPLVAANRLLAPFFAVNVYGLFAVMTTERDEIEVSGSQDGRSWRPYRFRWKPGPLERRPGFTGPHMPRLDWQMWFAALRGCGGATWFPGFLTRLLEGEPSVLALLDENPFPDGPPHYLRTRLYRYRFAAPGSSDWWQREPRGSFCPTVHLEAGRLVAGS